jgi:signal transduction histidine kinase
MERLKRLLISATFGSFISLVNWTIQTSLARSGLSPDKTLLDDFIVGSVAALFAYVLVTLQAERRDRERAVLRTRQQAVTDERNRMARELHDTVAQGLVGVVLKLEESESLLDAQSPAKKCLLRALELARESVRETRESVWNLRPQALRGSDLLSAIARLAKELTDGSAIRVEFSFGGSVQQQQLPHEMEKGVLRIGQEALTNVVKHARASKVNVELTISEEQLQLSVEDDGLGFVPECQRAGSGFGVRSMRERAQALGGTCQIYSQLGQGTRVRAVVPIGR